MTLSRDDKAVADQLASLRTDADVETLFALLGFEPASEPAAWGGDVPPGVRSARTIATAGTSLLGDPYRVLLVDMSSDGLQQEREAIERLRKVYPQALFVTACETSGHRTWRLVDVKPPKRAATALIPSPPGSSAGDAALLPSPSGRRAGDEGRPSAPSQAPPSRAVYRRMTVDAQEGASRTVVEQLLKARVTGRESAQDVRERVRAAFDVQAVTRQFFRVFVETFLELKRAILEHTPGISDADARTEAQTLLDRLVFLHFVQRRGWLANDRRFLAREFREKHASDPDGFSYYSEFLSGLFLELSNRELNLERGGRVPFLNGGLFDLDPVRRASSAWQVQVPNRAFGRAFARVFEAYNFTVREDTPLDVEVAVDPEMLGKVFESLILEGEKAGSDDDLRHATGSYYTPREVVHFMAREAIRTLLAGKLEREYGLAAAAARDKVGLLLAPGEFEYATSADLERVRAGLERGEAEFLRAATDRLRVLDPAVGSGAFLVGALHELVNVLKVLDHALRPHAVRDPNYAHELKLEVISGSLYGVDIQEQAVRITELRLWLSLVVDFRPPDGSLASIPTLPNLSYQVRRGDTLQDKVFDTPVNPKGLRARSDVAGAVGKYQALKGAFYAASKSDEKDRLERQLLDLRLDLAERLLRGLLSGAGEEPGLFAAARLTRAQQDAQARTSELRGALADLEELKRNRSGLGLHEYRAKLGTTFVWDVDFADVLADGGFDIVLANPPYLRQEAIDRLLGPGSKKRLVELYPRVGNGTADLYTYFYKRGVELLRPGGALCFISSNKFMRAGYGAKLRAFLSGAEGEGHAPEVTLRTLIDFGDLPVFEEATTYPMILVAEKRPPDETAAPAILTMRDLDALPDFDRYVAATARPLAQSRLSRDGWTLGDPAVLDLLDRLRKAGTPLGEFVNGKFYYGIKTGLNEAFVIDRATRDRLIAEDPKSAEIIKPFLRGRDVKRWRVDFADKYLLAVQNSGDRDNKNPWRNERDEAKAQAVFATSYPAVHRHLRAFEDRLRPRHDQGRFWWELRSCAYYTMFEQRKIVYPDISRVPNFAFDVTHAYLDSNMFTLGAGEDWLVAVLNSKLFEFCYRSMSPSVQGGFLRFKTIFLEHFPVVESRGAVAAKLSVLVRRLVADPDSIDVPVIEREIDQLVYDLYGVNNLADRALIEGTVSNIPLDSEGPLELAD